MNLGETIYKLRTEKGLSQGNLADMLEVSRQSISKWENNSAVPELDKLMKLSEIFNITLDELVKGEIIQNKEIQSKQMNKISQTQKTVGILFFAFAGLILLFGFVFHELILFSLILDIPFVICGIICLKCKKNAGLWCSWVMYVFVTSYLLWATGINWSSIFFYMKYPDFGVQTIISGILLALLILLIGITVSRFSKSIPTNITKTKKQLIHSLCIYIGLILLDFLFGMSPIYQYILDDIMTRAWLLTLINTFFDWTRVIAVIFTFIYLIRFVKYNKQKEHL